MPAPNLKRIPPAYLSELAVRYLGSAEATTWTRMAAGVSTVVYCLTRKSERFYLRILPETGLTFAPEVQAHSLARNLGCAVPEVLAYDPRDEFLLHSTMLTTEILGRPLAPGDSWRAVRSAVMAAGRDLARINSIDVDGYGWIERTVRNADSGLCGEHSTLGEMIVHEYRPAIERLSAASLPGTDLRVVRAALERAMEIVANGAAANLMHGDLDTSHIFVSRGTYAGIIDFGEIRGMPRFYDLGHHLMHDTERLPFSTFPWLLEGYREVWSVSEVDLERVRAWSQLIAIRALDRNVRHAPKSQIVAIARAALTLSLRRGY